MSAGAASSLHLVLQARLVGISKLPACLASLQSVTDSTVQSQGRHSLVVLVLAAMLRLLPCRYLHCPIALHRQCPYAAVCFIAGTYIDKKCPFTGDVSIRGRILSGLVRSTKMHRTIIIRRNYVHYIKKYAR